MKPSCFRPVAPEVDVANDHVDFVCAGSEWHGFLVGRLSISRFAELFSGGGSDYRIFEDSDAATGDGSDAREDVHARLLQSAAILRKRDPCFQPES